MSAAQLLADARAAGISVVLDGDTVRLRAAGPPEAVLIGRLKEAKTEIVAFLKAGPSGPATGAGEGPADVDPMCAKYREQHDWVLEGKLKRRQDRRSAMQAAHVSCLAWWRYHNRAASPADAIAGLAACGIPPPP